MPKILFSFVIAIVLSSCMKTHRFKVLQPAEIETPNEVKKIGILNRTTPNEVKNTNSKIDEILSIEGLNLDQKGAESAISSLANLLNKKNQRRSIESAHIVRDSLSLSQKSIIPEPLPLDWETIHRICLENKVDGLYVLEYYDTRSTYTQRSAPTTVNVPGVGSVPTTRYYVDVVTHIDTYWRLYDHLNETIIDDVNQKTQVNTKSQGISFLAALNSIKGREQNVIRESGQLGYYAAKKLEPYHRTLSRKYYSKGSDQLEQASRSVETFDYEKAISIWEQELTTPDTDLKSKILFNLALAQEIHEDLGQAVEYANESYALSGNKKAKRYALMLRDKIEKKEERILNQ